jgi:hypothetical protein
MNSLLVAIVVLLALSGIAALLGAALSPSRSIHSAARRERKAQRHASTEAPAADDPQVVGGAWPQVPPHMWEPRR